MDGDAPAVLLRDRDDKFGPALDREARGVGAKVIRAAVRAPNMNAISERFVGSVRRELLDHVLVLDEEHLGSLLRQYQLYFNESTSSGARVARWIARAGPPWRRGCSSRRGGFVAENGVSTMCSRSSSGTSSRSISSDSPPRLPGTHAG
jgi:hypothetical protein